jgi:hypothetical protein
MVAVSMVSGRESEQELAESHLMLTEESLALFQDIILYQF